MTETAEAARPSPTVIAAPSLLAVRNIEVVYDDVILVLRGLSLDVPKGAIVALLGANGAGKSTTLKAISGLLKTEDGEVTRGEILFEGERINGIDPDKIVRRGIFQVMEGRRIVAVFACTSTARGDLPSAEGRRAGDSVDARRPPIGCSAGSSSDGRREPGPPGVEVEVDDSLSSSAPPRRCLSPRPLHSSFSMKSDLVEAKRS